MSVTAALRFATCGELPAVLPAQRRAIAAGARDSASHAKAFAELDCLHRIERVESDRSRAVGGARPVSTPRIAFWNIERGKYLDRSAGLLRSLAADVILLCEVDVGMARSGQRHVARELAAMLATNYVFGVEYLELGLGDERERRWHAGERNAAGLHGAAILSPLALARPALARLEWSGDWFDGSRGERRVGGRMALLATVRAATAELVVACAHLESHSDPAGRAGQMATLLAAIDHYSAGLPVILGGDFNTKSAGREELTDPERLAGLLAADPQRLRDPVPYEPLFELAARHGYQWQTANTAEVTQRTRPDGTPAPPLARLDWFFTRGLTAHSPRTVAAVDAEHRVLSDHEILTLSVTATDAL